MGLVDNKFLLLYNTGIATQRENEMAKQYTDSSEFTEELVGLGNALSSARLEADTAQRAKSIFGIHWEQ